SLAVAEDEHEDERDPALDEKQPRLPPRLLRATPGLLTKTNNQADAKSTTPKGNTTPKDIVESFDTSHGDVDGGSRNVGSGGNNIDGGDGRESLSINGAVTAEWREGGDISGGISGVTRGQRRDPWEAPSSADRSLGRGGRAEVVEGRDGEGIVDGEYTMTAGAKKS
ncbi:unnamed protein product, partial [Sphacelaria rigidula]